MSKDYGINVNLSAVFHDGDGTVDAGLNYEDNYDITFDCESRGKSLDKTVEAMLTQFIGHFLLALNEIGEKLEDSEPEPEPDQTETIGSDLSSVLQYILASTSSSEPKIDDSITTMPNVSEPKDFNTTISTLDKFLKSI